LRAASCKILPIKLTLLYSKTDILKTVAFLGAIKKNKNLLERL
jgi:hypothetical protein